MKNMKKTWGLVIAAVAVFQASPTMAYLGETSEYLSRLTTLPFGMSTGVSGVYSATSTDLARRQVIMAAAGDAGAFVAADGRMEVSGVLGDAMRIEQGILNEQNGGEVEATDVQLAGRVVEHAERLKQGME